LPGSGAGAAFKKGRGFAAWLGVVHGEHSTGGKQTLTGTSRRGNKYLRKLFVQGAHAVLLQKTKQTTGLSTWLAQLTSRKRTQVATVALANKMARMAWAVLTKGEAYRPPLVVQTARALRDWPAHDAWQKRQTWKSLPRFPHL
jgi:transposase